MASLEALRGYVLEEALARLLYDNGYRLLVSEDQDPDALTRGAHGLLVRGRGADHQADVLGELTLPTPFTLPTRVFVEAKYRGKPAGLRDVRNAHGVAHDVNEQYATALAGSRSVPMRRFHYRYALFSATGFSRRAQQYALAQQISLIDLSSPAFAQLLDAVNDTAQALYRLAEELRVSPFPLGQLRTAFRLALGTWTADQGHVVVPSHDFDGLVDWVWRAAQLNPARREPQLLPFGPLGRITGDLVGRVHGDLLLGFPAAPFVLVMRPNDPTGLGDYVARHGTDIDVNISWTQRGLTVDWLIAPADGSGGFELRFGLPELLEDWLLNADGAVGLRARDLKKGLLSSIAVFLDGRLVRLQFEPIRRR